MSWFHDFLDDITDPSLDDSGRGALLVLAFALLPFCLVTMALWLPLTLLGKAIRPLERWR